MRPEPMASLHIGHPVTDLDTWTAVFDGFAEIRRQAGVTAETIRHLHDDDRYVVVDLEFDTSEQAHAFLHYLQTQVWAIPANSPALAGTPEAKVLERVRNTRFTWVRLEVSEAPVGVMAEPGYLHPFLRLP